MIESQKDKLNAGAKRLEELDSTTVTLTKEQIEKQHKVANLIKIWQNEDDPKAEANWEEFERDLNSGLAIDSEVKKP